MHPTVEKLILIKNKVSKIFDEKQLKTDFPQIIAVSKTFSAETILPLLDYGHIHYGENKVQEAIPKWTVLKKKYNNINLHFLGRLQTNKAKKAIQLFDYIHSLDSQNLAKTLSKHEIDLKVKKKYFIQVNLDNEIQKSGIKLNELEDFYNYCSRDLFLNILGLMCIPPIEKESEKYFNTLYHEGTKFNLKSFSMGMTQDYDKAILCGSTFLRIGTAIFGKRQISK
jgi:hypothetical protein